MLAEIESTELRKDCLNTIHQEDEGSLAVCGAQLEVF